MTVSYFSRKKVRDFTLSLGWLFHYWTIQWTWRRRRLCRGLCQGTPSQSRAPHLLALWQSSLLASFWPLSGKLSNSCPSLGGACFRVELRPPWAEACSWLKATCGCKAFLLLLHRCCCCVPPHLPTDTHHPRNSYVRDGKYNSSLCCTFEKENLGIKGVLWV